MDCLGVLSIKNFFYDYDYEHNWSLAKQVNMYKFKSGIGCITHVLNWKVYGVVKSANKKMESQLQTIIDTILHKVTILCSARSSS